MERFGWTFCPGDKVMQVVNDYERDVFNGDLGVVAGIDPEEGELVVSFEGRDGGLRLRRAGRAGAGLCHHHPQEPGLGVPGGGDPAHHPALRHAGRATCSTPAVTRGKRLVVLVGQRRALAIAVRGQRPAPLVQAEGMAQGLTEP